MLPIFRYDHFYTTLAAGACATLSGAATVHDAGRAVSGLATGTTEALVFAPVERILALLQVHTHHPPRVSRYILFSPPTCC